MQRSKDFQNQVFGMLWDLTEHYDDMNGPTCAETAARIASLAEETYAVRVKDANIQKNWESRG